MINNTSNQFKNTLFQTKMWTKTCLETVLQSKYVFLNEYASVNKKILVQNMQCKY